MSFVSLVRFIGNDIPGIHGDFQSLNNLKYILKEEKSFENCKKIFIINRIINKEIEKKIIQELKNYNVEHFVIPFKFEEFIKIYNKEKENNIFSKSIHYLTNTNNARNFGINIGKKYSETTLIFDGSCFLTEELYFDFLNKNNKKEAIFVFPMYRTSGYEEVVENSSYNFWFEPQIGVKNIDLKFNENFMWPDDKTELLFRYKIEGYWDQWKTNFQEYETQIPLKIYCKGVFRLPTGTDFDKENNVLPVKKYLTRLEGLSKLLDYALTKKE